ncbi:hypothetical protein NE865_07388 [Phthorimaea operculella]|nr:hypothetical protein NE865_07388 [Phthorimaea operculella]
MTPEQKLTWLCQECYSKLPKWVGSETPASPAHRASTSKEPSPKLSKGILIKESDRKNITTRKPATPSSGTPPLVADVSEEGDAADKDVIAAISDRVLAAVRKELPSMFEKILNTELGQLKDEFQVIRSLVKSQKAQLAKQGEELKQLQEFSDFIGKSHDDMKEKTDTLVKENSKLLAQISELKHEVHYLSDRLNNLDQYLRECNIEIHGVPEFRTEKLSTLIKQYTHSSTPVVCLVIEGGTNTVRAVLEYVTDTPPVPVVVCDGSGRAADLIAFVHKYASESGEQTVLESMREYLIGTIMKTFEVALPQAECLYSELLQCTRKKNLVSFYPTASEGGLCAGVPDRHHHEDLRGGPASG